VVFQTDYNKIKLQKISYGVIFVMSSSLRHRKIVTKITSQDFFHFGLPLPVKITGYANGYYYGAIT